MSDWDTVVLRKRQPKASAMKTECAINQVRTKHRFIFYSPQKWNANTQSAILIWRLTFFFMFIRALSIFFCNVHIRLAAKA